jgi:thymidylate kinase
MDEDFNSLLIAVIKSNVKKAIKEEVAALSDRYVQSGLSLQVLLELNL